MQNLIRLGLWQHSNSPSTTKRNRHHKYLTKVASDIIQRHVHIMMYSGVVAKKSKIDVHSISEQSRPKARPASESWGRCLAVVFNSMELTGTSPTDRMSKLEQLISSESPSFSVPTRNPGVLSTVASAHAAAVARAAAATVGRDRDWQAEQVGGPQPRPLPRPVGVPPASRHSHRRHCRVTARLSACRSIARGPGQPERRRNADEIGIVGLGT